MKLKKVIKILLEQGPYTTFRQIREYCTKKRAKRKMRSIIRELHLITDEERKIQVNNVFSSPVTFSIITPLYNTPKKYLIELLDSLEHQTYSHWQLCLADGSDKEHQYVGKICKEYADKDSRICYKTLDANRGISENTNECLKMATGDYIGLLDHDDVLHESALYEMMKVIDEEQADFLYSDEVKWTGKIKDIDNPLLFNLKPEFGKDDLRSHNYICHFTVFSKKLLGSEKRFYRKEYDGSQDHDMILRLTEKAKKIVHIPKVLYYWRVHNNSVSQNLDSKSYAVDAAIRAVSEQLKRQNESGKVRSSLPFRTIYKVDYNIEGTPLVSIVLHNCNTAEDIKNVVEKITAVTSYKNVEILYLFEQKVQFDLDNHIYIKWLENKKTVGAEEWNFGIQHANGDYIILMDAKCQPVNSKWIDEMLMFAQREDVISVGPKIYYENRSIAYAGIALSDKKKSGLYWLCQHNTMDEIGYEGMLCHARDTAASSAACMMFRKNTWEKNGKFNLKMGKYADVDFCLRGSKNKKWNVWTSYSEILYKEKNIISKFSNQEIDTFKTEWNEEIAKGTCSHPKWEELGLV